MISRKNPFRVVILLVIAGIAHAQNGAKIELSHASLIAGEPLEASMTLNSPSACTATAYLTFKEIQTNTQFSLTGTVTSGEKNVTLKGNLPLDLPGGEYRTSSAYLSACQGYMNGTQISIPVVAVVIKALDHQPKFPTSAELTLSLTQKEFLDTKISQLNELDTQITTKIEGKASDTAFVHSILISTIESAKEALDKTEREYSRQLTKPGGAPPAFFADFRAQYQALLIDLSAPIPGSAAWNTEGRPANLIYVQQLVRRGPTERPSNPQNLSGTYPPSVIAVRKVISDNAAAYRYIKNTGRITFDAELTSVPTGARIQYRKIIDSQFEDYSSPTDVPHATFELATWVFKFQKFGCKDEHLVRIDPYEDYHPDISVEFNDCRKR